jgi:hypothetical protein
LKLKSLKDLIDGYLKEIIQKNRIELYKLFEFAGAINNKKYLIFEDLKEVF